MAEKGLEARGPSRYGRCRGCGCLGEDAVLSCGCALEPPKKFEMKQNWTVPTQEQYCLLSVLYQSYTMGLIGIKIHTVATGSREDSGEKGLRGPEMEVGRRGDS